MNKEEAIKQLYRLSLDWEEDGAFTKLNQTDINAIGMVISELEIVNKKLERIKEYCKEDAEYWGNDSYINGLHEGYKDAINGVLSIIGGE